MPIDQQLLLLRNPPMPILFLFQHLALEILSLLHAFHSSGVLIIGRRWAMERSKDLSFLIVSRACGISFSFWSMPGLTAAVISLGPCMLYSCHTLGRSETTSVPMWSLLGFLCPDLAITWWFHRLTACSLLSLTSCLPLTVNLFLLLDGWVCGSKEFSNNRPQLPVRNGHDETQDLQRWVPQRHGSLTAGTGTHPEVNQDPALAPKDWH